MKKRWLSFALVVAMAATFVPVNGSAVDVDAVPFEAAADSDGFSYEQKLLEDERQSSTRFIVKYKDSAQGEREELIASSKEAFRQLKAEKENRRSEWGKHIPAERLERMQPQRKAKVFAVREVTANPILESEPEVRGGAAAPRRQHHNGSNLCI